MQDVLFKWINAVTHARWNPFIKQSSGASVRWGLEGLVQIKWWRSETFCSCCFVFSGFSGAIWRCCLRRTAPSWLERLSKGFSRRTQTLQWAAQARPLRSLWMWNAPSATKSTTVTTNAPVCSGATMFFAPSVSRESSSFPLTPLTHTAHQLFPAPCVAASPHWRTATMPLRYQAAPTSSPGCPTSPSACPGAWRPSPRG